MEKTYRVLVNGRNILTDYDGRVCKVGFYTTRFVVAPTASKAVIVATDLVRRDPKVVPLLQNDELDPPVFAVQEVEECAGQPDESPNPGLAFYLEEVNQEPEDHTRRDG